MYQEQETINNAEGTAKEISETATAETPESTPDVAQETPIRSGRTNKGSKTGQQTKLTPATTGKIFLILHASGKYQEVAEKDLSTKVGTVLNEAGIRIVDGELLLPELNFRRINQAQ